MRKEWICLFKGHHSDDLGYCDRCEKDYNDWIESLPTIIYWRKKYYIEWIFRRCDTCGKVDKFMGKYVGNHDKCLPF